MKHDKKTCACIMCIEIFGEETWIDFIEKENKVLERYGLLAATDIRKLKSHQFKLWFWKKLKGLTTW